MTKVKSLNFYPDDETAEDLLAVILNMVIPATINFRYNGKDYYDRLFYDISAARGMIWVNDSYTIKSLKIEKIEWIEVQEK